MPLGSLPPAPASPLASERRQPLHISRDLSLSAPGSSPIGKGGAPVYWSTTALHGASPQRSQCETHSTTVRSASTAASSTDYGALPSWSHVCHFSPGTTTREPDLLSGFLHASEGFSGALGDGFPALPSAHGERIPANEGVTCAGDVSQDLRSTLKSLKRLQSERQQLVDWGETLHKEVSRLEKEKMRLEGEVREIDARHRCLEGERARLQKRCSELEGELQKVTEAQNDLRQQLSDKENVSTQNAELRRQLSECAAEISTLRGEKAAALHGLSDAQRATTERDRANSLALNDLKQDHKQLQLKYTQLGELMAAEAERKRSAEDQLREAQAELAALRISLNIAESGSDQGREEMKRLQNAISNRDRHISALEEVLGPLSADFSELREAFETQTQEYHAFARSVSETRHIAHSRLEEARKEMRELEDAVAFISCEVERTAEHTERKHSDEWHDERLRYENRLEESQRKMRLCEEELEKMSARKSPTSGRRHRREPSCNASREIRRLEEGTVLEKVSARSSRREKRFVSVSCSDLRLRWGKDLQGRRQAPKLDLSEVIRIDYGCVARAHRLHPDLKPWLCFSLYTTKRSFDFCSMTEEAAQFCILGVSRLCCGWAAGTITTRSRFMCLKALCKIDAYCKSQGSSRCRLLKDAVERTARERGVLVEPWPRGRNPPPELRCCNEEDWVSRTPPLTESSQGTSRGTGSTHSSARQCYGSYGDGALEGQTAWFVDYRRSPDSSRGWGPHRFHQDPLSAKA